MTGWTRPLWAGAAAILAAGTASAQVVDARQPETVLEATRAFGHKAKLETDENGYPLIRAEVDGINYAIYFYGCNGTVDCTQIQLASSFNLDQGLTTDFVNTWNEDWVIGRLSIDKEGDPLFTYFLTTEGGVSRENFDAVLDVWTGALMGVVEDIGF